MQHPVWISIEDNGIFRYKLIYSVRFGHRSGVFHLMGLYLPT